MALHIIPLDVRRQTPQRDEDDGSNKDRCGDPPTSAPVRDSVGRRGVPISAAMLRTSDVASRFHAWAHPARRNGLWALSVSFQRAGVERTHSSWGPGGAPPAMRRCERHTRRWQFPEEATVRIGAVRRSRAQRGTGAPGWQKGRGCAGTAR